MEGAGSKKGVFPGFFSRLQKTPIRGIVSLGAILSLGAPLGWLIIENLVSFSGFDSYRTVLYVYMTFGTLIAFGVFSAIIGVEAERFLTMKREIEERERLMEMSLKEARDVMLSINQFGVAIGESETEDEVCYKLVRALHAGLDFDGVCLFKREGDYLVIKEAYGIEEGEEDSLDEVVIPCGSSDAGAIGIACTQGRSFLFTKEDYIPPEFRLKPPYNSIKPFRVKSFLVVPIVVEEGEPAWGVVTADRKKRNLGVTTDDLTLVELLVDIARTTLKRIKLKERLELLATTDELTGLYNRRFWMEVAEKELERSRRYNQPFAVIMADIDDFKKVNDTFGHQAGDRVLRAMGELIKGNIRNIDIAGRYGGEEFTILLPQISPESGFGVAERLRGVVETTDMGVPTQITATFGVSGFDPTRGERKFLDQVLMEADTAMYHGKRAGKNRVVSYWSIKGNLH